MCAARAAGAGAGLRGGDALQLVAGPGRHLALLAAEGRRQAPAAPVHARLAAQCVGTIGLRLSIDWFFGGIIFDF